jgi:hypothetical protein
MICPSCNAENREGAKFCAKCGTPLGLASWAEQLPPGELSPTVRAQKARFGARLSEDGGDADKLLSTAIAIFREFDLRFWRAVTQLEYAEWLSSDGPVSDIAAAAAEEATATFEELGARAWVDRADRLAAAAPVHAA